MALILRAELATDQPTIRLGLYGYFFIQAAAAVALWRSIGSWIFAALFIVNVAFFTAVDRGVFGPNLEVIGSSFILIFLSTIAGGIVLVREIARTIPTLPGGPAERLRGVLISFGVGLAVAVLGVLLVSWIGDLAAVLGSVVSVGLLRPGIAAAAGRSLLAAARLVRR